MASTRRVRIFAATALVVLLGAGAYVTWGYMESNRIEALRAITPDFATGFQESRTRPGEWCFTVGEPDLNDAERFVWEDVRIKQYLPDAPPRVFAPFGVRGEVRDGDRTCGYEGGGYYDFLYVPTGLVFNFHYPGCAGSPEARNDPPEYDTACYPPRGWPQS